jgi:glycosyltransferase involved in cell wall biosynthesis
MGAAGAPVWGARGRVVMLVDNGVNGDSRVQKEAMSAAAAGWEVILLGRSPDDRPQTWRLGDAEVRLIPMPSPLTKRPHEFRRSWLRGPFGYPPTGIAAHRAQRVRAWQADLRVRGAAFTLAAKAGKGGVSRLGSRASLRARGIVIRMIGSWVRFRTRQLTRAQRGRRTLSGPWDRTYAYVWRTVLRERSWRKLEPRLWDFEIAFGKVVDELSPDIIHANDFYMIGVGARAKLRALAADRELKLVWDVHELVSGIRSRSEDVRWLRAHIDHEKEFAPYADAAVTVSDELAEVLQRVHRLPERPTVVLNAPITKMAGLGTPAPDIRALCGIGPDVPLMVYSGAAAAQRGLGIIVEALSRLDGVHAGFIVAHPTSRFVRGLMARAKELGVTARVHLLPYVPIQQIVPFLAGADIGVIPIHHYPNHEIALITKFFEYAHAHLPMIVSDVRTMAATTRDVGQGEVFKAEDLEDFIRAVKAILSDPQRYRTAYDRPGLLEGWTWEAQAVVLAGVYSRLRAE